MRSVAALPLKARGVFFEKKIGKDRGRKGQNIKQDMSSVFPFGQNGFWNVSHPPAELPTLRPSNREKPMTMSASRAPFIVGSWKGGFRAESLGKRRCFFFFFFTGFNIWFHGALLSGFWGFNMVPQD